MKKLLVMMIALALVAVMVLPAGVAAAASPQEDVSGYFVLATTGFDPKIVGADHLMKGWIYHMATYTEDSLDGGIVGEGLEACHFTYNMKSLALASVGVHTFTGSVLGKTGTLTFQIFHGGFVELGKLGEAIEVEQTIISGTGDLANLRGTLHFTVYFTASGTYEGSYSGRLHLAP